MKKTFGLLPLCALPMLNSCNEYCSPEIGCEDYREISITDTKKGYAYVDLGLSVDWATQNVGATHAEDFGGYYAWAETKEKANYTWGNYTYCEGTDSSITKYSINENRYSDIVDSLKVLQPIDDAATAILGDDWRIPTSKEVEELVNGCEWEWIENMNGSGNSGLLGTSKANGNSIFLPAGGYKADVYHNDINRSGHYQAANISKFASSSYEFLITNKYKNLGYNHRFQGRNIRPVTTNATNTETEANNNGE